MITELQFKKDVEDRNYYKSLPLPDKIERILEETGGYMKVGEIADEIARRDEMEDVTGFTQQISKRLFKMKRSNRVVNLQQGRSKASTVWGLSKW